MSAKKLSRQLSRITGFLPGRPARSTKTFNPARDLSFRAEVKNTLYTIFDYNAHSLEEHKIPDCETCKAYAGSERITWINVDGLKKDEVEDLCKHYHIHYLVVEDILNVGQRAKMDEIGEGVFCLLPMLYYNPNTAMVEAEQVSIVLGNNFVISFQEDQERDVFNPVRDRLRGGNAKLRGSGADYLCYSLIDVIVDSYFPIIEKLHERAEKIEDDILQQLNQRSTMARISLLRREVMTIVRYLQPVRDLVNGFVRSENAVLNEANEKYFRDVLDHIIQANESADGLREMITTLQELSMNQVNLRTNEVVKVFTIITTLLAPATVIGGIFGMNFDVIPLAHKQSGFYLLVSMMFIIPLFMLAWFKKKGWF